MGIQSGAARGDYARQSEHMTGKDPKTGENERPDRSGNAVTNLAMQPRRCEHLLTRVPGDATMNQVPDNWHRDFFGGLWLEVQRLSFSDEENREIAQAIGDILQLEPASRVLDVPCGDGRLTVELAAAGLDLTGVERESLMLERARALAGERGVEVNWLQQDMWSLDAGAGFAAALCPWTSLGYGSREQDQGFFDGIARALDDGGLFLFETHVYETLLHDFEDRVFRWAGDVLVAEEREFVPEDGCLCTDWTFSRSGEIERRKSKMQLYTVRELDRMLEKSGMRTVASWGSWELDAFEVGAPILISLARRG
jgi:SAM-dependent methyltransferase